MYVYIPSPGASLPLPYPTISVITECRAEFSGLYDRFLLAIYFTYGSVYMSLLLFQFVPSSPSPAGSTSPGGYSFYQLLS